MCELFDKFVKDRSDRAISEMRLSGVFPSQLKQVLKRSDLEEQHAPAVIKRPYSLISENRNNKEADSFVKKNQKTRRCARITLWNCVRRSAVIMKTLLGFFCSEKMEH